MINKKTGLITLILLIGFLSILFYLGKSPNLIGYTVVVFDANESLNLTNGVIKISQEDYVAILNISDHFDENKIIVDLSGFNLSRDKDVYVDLIVDNDLVDSKKIGVSEGLMGNNTIGLANESITTVNESNITMGENITETINATGGSLAVLNENLKIGNNRTVYFYLNGSWNLTKGIIKISIIKIGQEDYIKLLNATDYLDKNKVVINLDNFNLSKNRDIYVDLIISNELIDSKGVRGQVEKTVNETEENLNEIP